MPEPDNEVTVKELVALEAEAPEICRMFLEQKKLDQRHRRRFAWVSLLTQTVGNLSGLAALGILAIVAWHAIDTGAATQGSAIICTGAVSIVAVFVTGRLTVGRTERPHAARRSEQRGD
ncbi:hypothetical protein GPX89_09975 [Nocardia sp. ET3-3]|uniref:DUF2335 domain-containing protein n=1 Tax=Nocardia terrae TaxID=2675851 RepID=A0A7K1UT83_9NOCA|nr:hypothetical protein [Nocardia terrae]MVU77566.1 hypothetical protein [Nocardia terrae]